MNQIDLRINDAKAQYQPFEWIEGRASWNLNSPPKSIEVRLLWFTEGKGTTDMSIVEKITLSAEFNRSNGDAPFRFQLPVAPYSFSGKLISLVWAVEVVALPFNVAGRVNLVLSPDGREIELREVEKPKSDLEIRFRARKESYQQKRGAAMSVEPLEPKSKDSGPPSPWS